MSALGLYLHVPFCTRRCDYCDFYVVVGREAEAGRFVTGMESEIRAAAAALAPGEREADTIYIGGGTPSLLPPESAARLVRACRDAFDVASGAEVTLEANPEGIDDARLAGWLEAGVNRLSVGVQTLDDAALKRRGRLHGGREALDALRAARRAGFANVSADLIAGLPDAPGGRGPGGGTSRAGGALGPEVSRPVGGRDRTGYARRFVEQVGAVLAERPDHLSVYLFETDKDTPLMRAVGEGKERLPADDDVADAYRLTVEETARAGYEQYEISNFCLQGRRSRHNMKYWTGEPYLGFGPSAHSHFRGRRYAAPRDLDAWRPAGPDGPLDYTLPDRDAAAREALILNLRLTEGVDLDAFDRRHGTDARSWVRRDLPEPMSAGLVRLDGSRLALTPRGRLLANEVFARLS